MSNRITICPNCGDIEDKQCLARATTLAYYPPIICKKGINTNRDMNTETESYRCMRCKTTYTVDFNKNEVHICDICDEIECDRHNEKKSITIRYSFS